MWIVEVFVLDCEVWIRLADFHTFACEAGLHVAEVFVHEKKSSWSGAAPTDNQPQLLSRLSADVQQPCSP